MQGDPFPLLDILRDSLYYPASGFDGTPVKYLAGCVFSFVYVDCGYSREELENELTEHGFRGYELIDRRSVTVGELFPLEAMHYFPLDLELYEELGYHRFWGLHRRLQGDDRATRDTRELLAHLDFLRSEELFCDWFVFKREAHLENDHGPYRFSWLYIRAEAARAFDRLYVANRVAPKAVAVIREPFFQSENGIFARCALSNPAGPPKILLFGGPNGPDRNHETFWPDYRKPCSHEWKLIRQKADVQPHQMCREISYTAFLAEYIKERPGIRDDMSMWFRELDGGLE